jgi:hypothetical protein
VEWSGALCAGWRSGRSFVRTAPNTLHQFFGWGTKHLFSHRLTVFAIGDGAPGHFGWGRDRVRFHVISREGHKKATGEKVERHAKDDGHEREMRGKATKKYVRGEGGHFGKSQQKLSLPQLSIFPYFCLSLLPPISFYSCCFDNCCSRSREWAGAWMGTMGRVASVPMPSSRC